MSVMRFSNSTNISDGMLLSSSPEFHEMSRVVNISLTSTEEMFSRDLERELYEKTPSQYIWDTGSSDLVYRLDQEILKMSKQKIEESTDDLSKQILKVWNE